MKIAALLANGFEETEAIATIDILRRAGFQVDMLSIHDKIVTGSHQIPVVADALLKDAQFYDALFLPGGQPGTTNLANDQRVIKLVQTFAAADKPIGAICAAPLVLEKAGILANRRMTSYPMKDAAHQFADAQYLEETVVLDGKLLTSRGVGTVLPFAFAFVELLGKSSADLQKSVVYSLQK